MGQKKAPPVFNSVSELLRALGLPAPQHPLLTVTNYAEITADVTELSKGMVLNMYKISLKFNFRGKIKYGQQYYDFDEGGLSFASPMQVIAAGEEEADYSGLTLLIHPDFLRNYPLAKTIKDYGFFDYSVNEALGLSEQEKDVIMGIFESIKRELHAAIDHFSQDIIISQIEQLLNYSNRFYNRQFITRKAVHNDQLSTLDDMLRNYFDRNNALFEGIPAVEEIAAKLNVSQRYLSDMLRTLVGVNTQQYIQLKMIHKARELLSTTDLTIAEIAYQLGFEYPQSFNKFFKKQTTLSPLDFRKSFN
ncbi:helix-turn-helix domain-containing protein [Chitinophaga pinensis]|uniref:Transcriptional regulator, AraC family n=1 Tax=Chitinophaga pinensis (strain ATCC 43595 / DSM 2588 / LMG 13176 / NBRC 15968 / NCIMB 11800 / UQM 2034) TaxID=485918 RepID=A0A979G3K0_CHIPD|nr:helix-turn-helix domain-containing protein [Chitinophaga pinensis]ACU60137.1 transcriptional regulator, AraC family [Chitinophaga pinensis DSM 2588]